MLEYVDYQLLSPEMLPALIEIKKRMEAASNSNAAEKKRLEKQKADTMRKVGNLIDFIEVGVFLPTMIKAMYTPESQYLAIDSPLKTMKNKKSRNPLIHTGFRLLLILKLHIQQLLRQ